MTPTGFRPCIEVVNVDAIDGRARSFRPFRAIAARWALDTIDIEPIATSAHRPRIRAEAIGFGLTRSRPRRVDDVDIRIGQVQSVAVGA